MQKIIVQKLFSRIINYNNALPQLKHAASRQMLGAILEDGGQKQTADNIKLFKGYF